MSLRQSLENLVSAVTLPRRILIASALAFISMPGLVAAQYQKLDGIVAVVDDDVVLASELLDRIDLVRRSSEESGTRLPPNDVLVSQIMERLILENLQRQEAQRRRGVDFCRTVAVAAGTCKAVSAQANLSNAQRVSYDWAANMCQPV